MSIHDELEAIMGRAKPNFTPCDVCQQLTTGPRCFDCVRDAEWLTSARQALEATIPASFRWARFTSDEIRLRSPVDARHRATEAVGSTRTVLLGESGCGKTSLAVCMARHWVEKQRATATFMLATDLAAARGAFGMQPGELVLALTTPMLVLDDMGSEPESKDSPVTAVVFKRHAEARPTVITTWMDQERMTARYGGGVTRRVFEGARIIECVSRP